jgi:hypothetical protein
LECSPERNKEKEEEEKICKRHDQLSKFQCRLARKLTLSNRLGDHTKPEIIKQMQRKHPPCKTPITPLTNKELSRPRKGIDRAVFDKELKSLKRDIAPGLGSIQNKHLLALLINPNI